MADHWINRVIRDLIAESELTQLEIAEQAGVHVNTIMNVVHHRNTPSIENVEAILKVLGHELEIISTVHTSVYRRAKI